MRHTVWTVFAGTMAVIAAWAGRGQFPPTTEWIPPKTSIPADFVRAVRALLGTGFADPRPGVFSRVSIVWHDPPPNAPRHYETFGWVLPDGRHAVLCNGVEAIIEKNPVPIAIDWLDGRADSRFSYDPGDEPELPALLLVAGRVDLAESYTRSYRRGAMIAAFLEDLWIEDQEACADARGRGSYLVGLDLAKRMVVVAQYAHGHGVALPDRSKERETDFSYMYVGASTPADDLEYSKWVLADCQRCLDEAASPHPGLKTILKMKDPERTHALIDRLGQPVTSDDPGYRLTLEAFKQVGLSAIPLLEDAVKHDLRLVVQPYEKQPSVWPDIHFGGGPQFRPAFYFWPARDGESEAIYRIKNPKPFRLGGGFVPPTKQQLAKQRLAEEQKHGGFLEAARTAIDIDGAGIAEWADAAAELAKGADKIVHGQYQSNPLAKPRLLTLPKNEQRETIRALVRRCKESSQSLGDGSDFQEVWACASLCLSLSRFGARAAVPFLKLTREVVMRQYLKFGDATNGNQVLRSNALALIASASLRGGDLSATAEYARLLAILKPNYGFDGLVLKPMWTSDERRSMRSVEETFFRRFEDPFSAEDLTTSVGEVFSLVGAVERYPVLTVPAYRSFLSREILDSRSIGTVWLCKELDKEFAITSQGLENPSTLDPQRDRLGPVPPTISVVATRVISVGDLCCKRLSAVFGAPRFSLEWDEEHKALARAQIALWLSGQRDWLRVEKMTCTYGEVNW